MGDVTEYDNVRDMRGERDIRPKRRVSFLLSHHPPRLLRPPSRPQRLCPKFDDMLEAKLEEAAILKRLLDGEYDLEELRTAG